MPKPIDIHVTVISHRHGDNVYAHRTEQGAQAEIADFCDILRLRGRK